MPKKHFRPTVLEFLTRHFQIVQMEGGCPPCTSVSYDYSHTSPQPMCLFPHLSTTQLTSPPLFSHPQPVNTHLVHSPTLNPYSIPHLPQHMGANPGRMRDAYLPRIRQHPPNTFHVQVAYQYSKLGISKRDDFFLVFTSFWTKNWASANVMTFFWSLLHFGQKTGHQQT